MARDTRRSDKMLKKAARRVLYFRREGKATDEDARAARLVFQGRATAADEDRVLGFLPTGGKSRFRQRKSRGPEYSQMVRSGMDVSRDVQLLDGGGGLGVFRLANTVADGITKNRKAMRSLSEGVAKNLGKDPALASKFIGTLAKFARLGGWLAAGAAVVGEVGTAFYGQIEKGAKAGTRLAETVAGASPADRKIIEQYQREALEQVKKETVFFTGSGDLDTAGAQGDLGSGDQYLRGKEREKAEGIAGREIARFNKYRQLMAQRYKIRREINRRARMGADEHELAQYLAQQAKESLEPSREEIKARMASRYYDRTGWQQGYVQLKYTWFESSLEEEREAARQEVLDRRLKNEENYQKRMQRLREQRATKFSPKEEMEMQMAADEKLAGFNGFRSRHKMVHLD